MIKASKLVFAPALALCGLVCTLAFASAPALAINTHVLSFSFGSAGSGAGQLSSPAGVAVDAVTHDVYVADQSNFRVDEFSSSGSFVRAWGWGVTDGLPEFQTCTFSCRGGLPGSGAGQLTVPAFVAVDNSAGPSQGDVYVGDTGDNRVSKFTSEGALVGSWGADGALNGSTTDAGSFASLEGIAVNDGGTLMVLSLKEGSSSMFEFAQEGTLSSEFGVERETSPAGLAVDSAGNFFKANGSPNVEEITASNSVVGQVSEGEHPMGLAVEGSTGNLYVSTGDEVEHYAFAGTGMVSESEGGVCTFGSSSGCPATDTFGQGELSGATGVAVDSSNGDVYVADAAANELDVFTPALLAGLSTGQASNPQPTTAMVAGTVNPAGVPITACTFEYGTSLAYGQSAPCEQSPASIGAGSSPVPVSASLSGLAPNTEYHFRLAASNAHGTNHGADMTLTTLGPPRIDGESTANPTHTGIELQAQLDPSGLDTTYHFEYGTSAAYGTSIPIPDAAIGSAQAEQGVSQQIAGLLVGATYHYRVVASNSAGTVDGPDQTFTTIPAALIDGVWVTDVTSTSATLGAQVNPLGVSTDYRLEYGTSTAYGQTLTGNVGEGDGDAPISYHRQDLTPGTTYHYRIVTTNTLGTNESADHTFTTRAAGGEALSLPDGRRWELVSPVDKGGALVGVFLPDEPFQAAANGSAIAYPASEPIGEGARGRNEVAMILSKRGTNGWSSQDISPPTQLADTAEGPARTANTSGTHVEVFSPDLALGLYEPALQTSTPLSPEATERTLYVHDEPYGSYLPLETSADVTSGAKFEDRNMDFLAATPDLSHVIFWTDRALTPEAVPYEEPTNPSIPHIGQSERNLYEWSAGKLQLVNITPPTLASPNGTTEPGAFLGSTDVGAGVTATDMSSNGRWVAWSHGRLSAYTGNAQEQIELYVRDMVAGRSYRVGGQYARFEAMSRDGSKVFYIESSASVPAGDLHVFDTATGANTDLTANHGPGESSARVQDAVMGTSEDGSYVYFVATGVLASGAVKGADNVYVLHESEGVWTTRYIATLASDDAHSWRAYPNTEVPAPESLAMVYPEYVSSRVSPNGRYLAFMSERSLTGYDNSDAVSGQPDEEVYLYDAVSSRLVCASCNPTGARPNGVFDTGSLYADLPGSWTALHGAGNHWLAGSIPGWAYAGSTNVASYQPRYLSDSGRLFFDSPDALVPQDTNGLEDVYEYESEGIGDCSSGTSGGWNIFVSQSAGCVGLISSGQSSGESIFIDASESGGDVFFATDGKLASEDDDASYDIYDAHVCSAEAACYAVPAVSTPPCASGDACKAAPSPQPAIFGAPPSATFNGAGNVAPSVSPKVTAKSTSCRKGYAKKRGKCVEQARRKRKRSKRAKKTSGRVK